MDLKTIRNRINRIDSEIIKLLQERMELSMRTKRFKKEVRDEERENQVFENIREASGGLVSPEFSTSLFEKILQESERLQRSDFQLVGFQGEHGAFSESAARQFDSRLIPVPYKEFINIFEEVKSRSLDYGICPVENSTEGPVNEVMDFLIAFDLKIIAEIEIPINHSLLSLPETEQKEIKIVYSHPQALAQCRHFLLKNKLEPRPFYDTAGAAKMLASSRRVSAGVIAPRDCGRIYHLKVLQDSIQDEKNNFTRFVVLAREDQSEIGDKCSLIFSVKDEPGALCRILEIFSERDISLTRILSRPNKSSPGDYIFLVDFRGSLADQKVFTALSEVQSVAEMYKFLGCYKEVFP
ncbi:MAG: prephenate dehydratase [Clostridiales bacterium]|nr:prephenate dehydratase [Clostridiales bacterium]